MSFTVAYRGEIKEKVFYFEVTNCISEANGKYYAYTDVPDDEKIYYNEKDNGIYIYKTNGSFSLAVPVEIVNAHGHDITGSWIEAWNTNVVTNNNPWEYTWYHQDWYWDSDKNYYAPTLTKLNN